MRIHGSLPLSWLLALSAACAQAAVTQKESAQAAREPAACIAAAAQYHHVNPWLLRAILKVESDFNPGALHRNANGTLDVGMAQINSVHFPELARWGVMPSHLMDGCTAVYVAAWHLQRQIERHGNSWFGVASYHSTSPCQNRRYAALLWNTLQSWGAVQGARLQVASLQQCEPPTASGSKLAASTAIQATPLLAFDRDP